jgi:hypothetical protein
MADLEFVLESVLKVTGQKNIEKAYEAAHELNQEFKSINTVYTTVAKNIKTNTLGIIAQMDALKNKSRIVYGDNGVRRFYRDANNQQRSFVINLDKSARLLGKNLKFYSRYKTTTFKLSDNSDVEGIKGGLESRGATYKIAENQNYEKATKLRIAKGKEAILEAIRNQKELERFRKQFAADARRNDMMLEREKDNAAKREIKSIQDRAKAAENAIKDLNKLNKQSASNSDKAVSGIKKQTNAFHELGRSIDRTRHMWYALGGAFVASKLFGGARDIAGGLFDQFREGIDYNSEMIRAKTTFKQFGLIGTGKNVNQMMMSTDPKDQARLQQSGIFAGMAQKQVNLIASQTGESRAEINRAFRSLLPNLIEKAKKGKSGNALFDNKEDILHLTSEAVRISSIMKMQDGGHNLAYFTKAFDEMFAGTNSEKGAKSLVTSINRRFNMSMSEQDAQNIKKQLMGGNFKGLEDALTKRLEKNGVSTKFLDDFVSRDYQRNVDGLRASFEALRGEFTNPSYQNVLAFFSALRAKATEIQASPFFSGMITKWGEKFANVLDSTILRFTHFVDSLTSNDVDNFMNNAIEGFERMTYILEGIADVTANFSLGLFEGLTGGSIKGAQDFRDALKQAAPYAKELGVQIGNIARWIGTMAPYLSKILPYINQGALGGAIAGMPFGPLGVAGGAIAGGVGWKFGSDARKNDETTFNRGGWIPGPGGMLYVPQNDGPSSPRGNNYYFNAPFYIQSPDGQKLTEQLRALGHGYN